MTSLLLFGASTAPAFADQGTYQVAPGDNLTRIALRFGMSLEQLTTLNGIADPNYVWAGQLLRISSVASPAAISAPAASPALPTRLIHAPYISQFDGSVYEQSNCGPTALAMGLRALGISTDQIELRHLAAAQMGFENPDSGTTWESLAYAATRKGATTSTLRQGKQYISWSFDDLARSFDAGQPALLLVRYRWMPGHEGSDYWGDHYVLALGFDAAGNLIYHDPATRDGSGAYRTITRDALLRAWNSTSVGLVRTAMAVGKG
ncbi:MAG TPA: C39 family peptidase [Chloroflexota bacterium]|nr:C39 family peptidase [Chloroflexota bacterium]